jgi:alkylmercury lyase
MDDPAALDDEVRRAAFALLLLTYRPVQPDEVAQAMPAGVDPAAVAATVDRLAAAGLLDRMADGAVIGSGGLTLGPGPHGLLVRGREYRTWCAYDAIGIPAGLGEAGAVSTRCPICTRPIALRFPDAASQERPERLWLSSGGGDLRADFCTPTVLLCSPEHAAAWGERHGGRGRVIDLRQAWRLGAGAWAGYAREVERLAPVR